jgi:hypothetical protein
MALKKDITLENGIQMDNAYIKVCEINYINKVNEQGSARVSVFVYKDQQARLNKKPEVIRISYKCTGSDFRTFLHPDALEIHGNNILTQSYKWLKTLSLFSNAQDIMDEKE